LTVRTTSAGAGIVQRDHFDGLIAAFIHALDDAHDAAHIAGAIRDDQHVAAGIGRQMPVLGNQGRSMGTSWAALTFFMVMIWVTISSEVELTFSGKIDGRHLPLIGVRNDLDDLAGRHRHVAVHLQHRQERLIELRRRHGRRRQHGDLGVDAGIDDEILAGDFATAWMI
jgi:hypothetical protein